MVFKKIKFKYIYGPVYSWRLGRSLGIDLVFSKNKICNFNCLYCQLKDTPIYTNRREIFVSSDEVIKELKSLPNLKLDYITFSGRGEPTLAKNLGEVIEFVKINFDIPVAVLTNGSLLYKKELRDELLLADLVAIKLDASKDTMLKRINRPFKYINFSKILKGIFAFRKEYKKKFALQLMFIRENKSEIKGLIEISKKIMPDEIQINTPLRPCGVKPLGKDEILRIKKEFLKSLSDFKNIKIISVYDKKIFCYNIALSKIATSLRRPI
ncbi:MAG: radical SAM protein [Candidatus Omnitrophica bacterium]|nr:radical SAM protein [Candidatus Omnitrophota bacterium]